MKWQIDYYDEAVRENILGWSASLLARYIRITDLMEKDGANLGMPFTKSLGDGLFEIRAKSQVGIGRAFFCYCTKKRIIILRAFIKKMPRTPRKELKIARKRMKEVMNYEL